MTTYRQVKGYSIKSVSTDPSNIKEGQILYNNTSKSIKVSPKISGFSSGGSLPAARQNAAGFGTSQAAGALAGGNAPGSYNNTETFEYDKSRRL